MSSKCKAIFAVASLGNSSAQFFKPVMRRVLTSVSCPTVLSTYSSTSHCLKQFLRECLTFLFFTRSCCSGRWSFLNYDVFVESAQKLDVRQFMKRTSISDSRSAETISNKRLRIEVQPAQTNGLERVKRFVNVHLHCIVSNMKEAKFRRCPQWRN